MGTEVLPENELWQRLTSGDRTARDLLVQKHLGLVRHVARRFAGDRFDLEDLLQVGAVGLIKAVDHFDPNRGLRFSTYAVPLITGEILRYMRDHGSQVKVPRSWQGLARRAQQRREQLHQKYGREPTLSELAADLQVGSAELLSALEAYEPLLSLDRSVDPTGDDPVAMLDKIVAVDDVADLGLRRALLHELLTRLTAKERQVVILRYFEDLTQQEIAHKLGASQSYVSRLLNRALRRMRAG